MSSDKAYAVEQRLNGLAEFTDAGGVNRYTSSVDGNTYAGGVSTTVCPGYSGTGSLAAITGMVQPVAAIKYRVDAEIIVTNGATGQAINLGLQGPAIADMRVQWYMFVDDPLAAASVIASQSLNSIVHWATPTLNSSGAGSNVYLVQVHGYVNFSGASGTLFGFQTSAVNAFTIVADSYMDLRPA